jgi:hypothetical protein
MANIEKITTLAPLFGDKPGERPATPVTDFDKLSNEGVNFETYAIKEGDILYFPTLDDMIVKSQPIRKGDSKTKVYMVACIRERNGRKAASWFNLNTLMKRDINNEPVQGEFYDAGNMKARLELLAEYGAITSLETRTIQVPEFGDDGKPKKEEVMDDEGNVTLRNKPQNQEVAIISRYFDPKAKPEKPGKNEGK